MNKKFCVYRHIFPNGKSYIGITSKKPNQRWENGKGYSKTGQNAIYNAIRKYGWENIKHEILFNNLTFEEARNKERELIVKYHTYIYYKDSNGYNMTLGGEGTLGHKISDVGKDKMRKAKLGKRGALCPNSKKVYCDGIIYDSLTEFIQKNKPKGNVKGWVLGKVKMPVEWYNKKLHYIDTDFSIIKCQETPWCNKIQYDNQIFNSQAELARYLNVAPSLICRWKKNPPNKLLERGFKIL